MFEIKIKFKLGQTVYYALDHGLYSNATVEQGTIQGFHIRKHKNGFRIGVDFKQYNNFPIELVSENKDEIQLIVDKYNATPVEDRIKGE